MKTCPACHRTVPESATVCPHAGCGKPLAQAPAGGAKKRPPPPPGKVQLAAGHATHTRAASSPTSDATSRRGPLATVALLLLLCLLVGGVYYAAVMSKSQKASEVAVQPARPSATADANKPPSSNLENKPAEAKSAGDQKHADQPEKASGTNPPAPPKLAEMTPVNKDEQAPTEVAAVTSQPLGIYSERTRPDREKWIAGVGGTPVSEQAVAGGLDWLARHQSEDGHWGPDCLGANGSRCEKAHPCQGTPGGPYEAALTGLPILAFQAGGNYYDNGKQYSENVRRGLDWLVERQGPNGEIVGSANQLAKRPGEATHYDQHYMYEHAIATFALAEACALAVALQRHPDEKYQAAAIKAVEFIESQQHNDGGWRYTPEKAYPSDASVSGWAMLALKTAKEADLPVEDTTLTRMTDFFERLADPLTGRTHYQGASYITHATTGVGMMVDEFVKHQADSDFVHLGASFLADQAETEWGTANKRQGDFYLWYNCTLAMFMAGGNDWDRWNNVIRDYVISLEVHGDGCDRGSWQPNDHWGATGGRIYTTALGVLTLEVYYRFAREKAAGAEEKGK
ncbi:MAG TPA: prenyltransferase/squalene oxidase repeat-containing protein [Pirellulales bacterium]|nr:prenyltransferase/squalene oxidase repeat-containing protein [Pirellulales bacterium]